MTKVTNIPGRLHSVEQGNIVAGANEIYDDTKGKKQNVINSETDAELLRLEQSKQDNLTFDNAPTENSNNPVKSGGVYAADLALQQAIEAILLLIPSAATSLNQLADKAFVNSSISTATATFRGTYNVVTDLHLAVDATHAQIEAALALVVATADNNDYCYVQIPVSASSQDIQKTSRYKFNGSAWVFEYDLNTSGFTSAQWAAINSGITAALVTKLGDLPTATEISNQFNAITNLIPSEATALNQLADKAYVAAQILAATPAFKGQFTTLADLQAVASPKAGDLGIVRTKDSDGYDVFTFYQYLSNAWNVYYTLSHHPQTKPATTGITGDYPYNGMGRVVLPMNIKEIGGVTANYLEQSMMPTASGGNTIYVIQYDFVLGEDITIPSNCVLEFNGGSISNKAGNTFKIMGSNTLIFSPCIPIFGNVFFGGTWDTEFVAEWLLPEYSANMDYSEDLNHLFNCGIGSVTFTVPRVYNITSTIVILKDIIIKSKFDTENYSLSSGEKVEIKSESNITIIEYRHTISNYTINIGGLTLTSGDRYNPDYTTPILLIKLNQRVWGGGNIDFDINCTPLYMEYGGFHYNRLTMVGVEVIQASSGAFLTFGGRISTYKGFYMHVTNGWLTDIHINSITECCYGGEFSDVSPIYLGGSHQSVAFPNDIPSIRPNEYYFYGAMMLASNAFIWDLGSLAEAGSTNITMVKEAYSDAYNGIYDGENQSSIRNYPTRQSVMFPNHHHYMVNKVSDFTSFNIECSQDDFTTVLLDKNDVLNIDGLLFNSSFLSKTTSSYSNNNNEGAFISPVSLLDSDVDTTKNLQVRYTARYRNNYNHYLKFKSPSNMDVKVTYKYYSDNYTTLVKSETVNNNMSGGSSTTERNTFCYIVNPGGVGNIEVIVEYEIGLSANKLYGKDTYNLIAFSLFGYSSIKDYYLDSKYLKTDFIVTEGNNKSYIPIDKQKYNQGFMLVAPTTLITDLMVAFDYVSQVGDFKGDCIITVSKNEGNPVTILGDPNNRISVYKAPYPNLDGWSYYKVLMSSCFVSIKWILGDGLYLDGTVKTGGQNPTGQSLLSATRISQSGTFNNKPSLSGTVSVGTCYFDTTNGKPIWWNGTAWVDATGAAV